MHVYHRDVSIVSTQIAICNNPKEFIKQMVGLVTVCVMRLEEGLLGRLWYKGVAKQSVGFVFSLNIFVIF